MNILFINYEFPPLGGGAGNANYFLFREFEKLGNLTIELITSSTDKQKIESFSENIKIHYIDIGKKGRNIHYQSLTNLVGFYFKGLKYAKRLTAKNKFDLVHAFLGIPSGLIAAKLGLPFIVSLRGSDVPFYNSRFKILDFLIFKRLSVRLWKKARFVIANSEDLKSLALTASPGQKISVIPNGVNTSLFTTSAEKNLRTGEKLILISTGRLIKRKNYDLLIKSLRGLPIKLVLVGDGNQSQNLARLSRQLNVNVEFSGKKNRDEIISILQKADVFILVSDSEGMSNSLLEAMASGLPVISSNVGGANSLINDNGIIINNLSESAIRAAIENYISNPSLLKKHGKHSRQRALNYTWASSAEKYLKNYE